MGKVAFPLHNVRKDVLNNWHFKQLSEDITVSENPDQYGFYTASLVEIPAPSSTSPVVIRGLSEYRKVPVDIKTGELTLPADSFYVNYNTGEILFHSSKAGNTYTAQYYGKGSLVEADDLNDVNERTESIESVVSSVQPTLDVFRSELDSNTTTISTMSEMVGLIESNVATVSTDVAGLKTTVNQKADTSYVESQLTETRNTLASYTSAGGEIDQRIDSKMADCVSAESYAADQADREAAYDEKYSQVSVVSALSTTVSENSANIASNLSKITTNEQDIQSLQSSVSQLSESKADKTAVDENTAAISELNATVADVASTAETNSANISGLDSNLVSTNETVSSISSRVEVIENDYVKSADIDPLATKEELGNYVPTSTLDTLATKSEISDMATKTDLQGYVETTVLDTLATKTDLNGYVETTVLDTLATKTDLDNYVPTSTLDTLATKSEISDMATKTDLQGYASTEDLQGLATKDELSGYVQTETLDTLATKEELTGFLSIDAASDFVSQDDIANFATKEDLEGYVSSDVLANYATTDAIADMATRSDLEGYVNAEALENYATTDAIADMATKTDLQGYVESSTLENYATTDAIADMATKTDLEDYLTADAITDMATKTDLESYVETSALENYVTTDAIADMATKTDLEGYVETSTLDGYVMNDAIADMATKTDLENYVETATLDNYVTTDAIADMATKTDLEGYVETDVLDTLATKTDLEDYVLNSALEDYATVNSLSNYVTNDDLDRYATKDEVAEGYVSNDVLGNLATKDQLETDMSAATTQINTVSSNVASNYFAFLDRITGLEMKVNNLSRANIVNIPSAAQITYSDPTGDVVIEADQTMTQLSEITAKSVEVKSLDINSDISAPAKFIVYTDGQVEISNLEIEGAYKAAAYEGTQVSVYSSDYVSIKDCEFNASGRNAIEIGLDVPASTRVSKSIFIDNCHFNGTLGNNAISVFGQQNDTIVKISNCTFTDVSNVLRISNRTNTKATFILENCTFSKWESDPQYGGVVICQDYKSGSVEAEESNNLFAPEKIKIQFINCTGPDGNKIVGSDNPADYCASGNENQLLYVYGNAGGIVSYDPARYPEVTFG